MTLGTLPRQSLFVPSTESSHMIPVQPPLSDIMGHHFDFHPHIILAESRYSDTGPDRLVSWHPLLEVAHHRLQCLIIDWDMVRIHPEYLLPAIAASVLQVEVNVLKGLVNLSIDFAMDHSRLGVPAPCHMLVS